MTTISKTLSRLTLIMAGSALIFVSCSKNNDVVVPGTDEKVSADLPRVAVTIPDGSTVPITGPGVTSGTITRNGALYTVTDFRQAYSTGPGQPADGNFYWRFTVNEAGNPINFEIKFTGIATGDITSNDSIRFINKSFASVVAADWASASNPGPSPAGPNVIGMNEVIGTGVPPAVIAFANGAGWYIYNWSAGHTVTPVAGRTLLWKKGSSLFKFQITSIYQGGVTGGPFPYYNFKYQAI